MMFKYVKFKMGYVDEVNMQVLVLFYVEEELSMVIFFFDESIDFVVVSFGR